MTWIIENWQWIVLALLVLDKIVAATPCKWDDLILTAIKGAVGSVTGRKLGVVVLAVVIAGASSACVKQELSTTDSLRLAGYELAEAYNALHAEYENIFAALDTDGQYWMAHNVAPVMNKARRAITAYNEGVMLYHQGLDPGNLPELKAGAVNLMRDLSELFGEVVDKWLSRPKGKEA